MGGRGSRRALWVHWYRLGRSLALPRRPDSCHRVLGHAHFCRQFERSRLRRWQSRPAGRQKFSRHVLDAVDSSL